MDCIKTSFYQYRSIEAIFHVTDLFRGLRNDYSTSKLKKNNETLT